MQKIDLPDYDIAVVGGGASGIYTAWRLLTEGLLHSPKLRKWRDERGFLKVAVFEGSNRIGGRILSAKAPGLPNVVCEIGGMRYVSSQLLIKSLVENKFALPRHEQQVTDTDNILLLRGQQLRVGDLSNPDKLPYTFAQDEIEWLNQNKIPKNTADNFLGFAVQKLFPEIGKYSGEALRDFLNKQEIDQVPLYKHGFWNLVATQLSHEAYRIAITTIGYDCLGFNTNAVDAICEYFDFTPGVKYYLLDDGYDSVIWTMQQEFEAAGGEVIIDTWLESFDNLNQKDESDGVSLKFKNDQEEKNCRAVILAMPRRSLELLGQKGPVLDPCQAPQVRVMMNAVAPVPLYKMFIAYDNPWWEKQGVTEGRSLTDIPIRQCYYWGVENKCKNSEPLNSNAILMVYNDALSSDFWGGLREVSPGLSDLNNEREKPKFKRKKMPNTNSGKKSDWHLRLRNNWKISEAPKAMVAEMHRQLQILHGVIDVPKPLEAAFVDWGDDPYGGAVHFWNSGYKSSEIMDKMIQPVDNIPCYVCGEAYSTNQTWVEGALQTAELVLRKFDIPEPQWLQKK